MILIYRPLPQLRPDFYALATHGVDVATGELPALIEFWLQVCGLKPTTHKRRIP